MKRGRPVGGRRNYLSISRGVVGAERDARRSGGAPCPQALPRQKHSVGVARNDAMKDVPAAPFRPRHGLS